jgi:hypothetical protein
MDGRSLLADRGAWGSWPRAAGKTPPQISGRFYADLYFVGDVWDASRADGEVADASSSL